MKRIFLLALLVWGVLAPITYHPDTKLTLRYPAIENNKIWDIYGYINSHKLDIPDFHYPPAHYWWLKVHYPISKMIGGDGFDEWLKEGNFQASMNINVFRYNLAAKFPLLFLGLISGWFIYLIVKKVSLKDKTSLLAAMFWYFNPVTLYSLVIMGQNDIVAISLFLAGILFIDKWWLTALFWGLASGVKSYPMIWAVIFLLAYEKKIITLIGKTLSIISIYGLILLPWLGKDYFIKAVLNSGLSQRMFVANIAIGYDKSILIVPLLLVIIGLSVWKKKEKNKFFNACLAIFQSCLVILGFSHFNPQWALWIIPFLSIWLSLSGKIKKESLALIIIFCLWFLLTLSFDDKFLFWGLFTPICPNLINLPTFNQVIINKGGNPINLINLFQSILAGSALWFLIKKNKIKYKNNINIYTKNLFILVPWFLILIIFLFLLSIKIENKKYAQFTDKEIYLTELNDKKWSYKIYNDLKYFEISLNNPSLNSQDKGLLVVTDNNQNKFEKEFSGFNAGANSWLRVDVPKNMSDSNVLYIETKDIVIKDGLLKIYIDKDDKWAINFYNLEKLSINEVLEKFFVVWWWWLMMGGVSFIYTKIKQD